MKIVYPSGFTEESLVLYFGTWKETVLNYLFTAFPGRDLSLDYARPIENNGMGSAFGSQKSADVWLP